MVLLAGLVSYDAAEQIYPAVGAWTTILTTGSVPAEAPEWRGHTIVRHIRRTTVDTGAIGRELLTTQSAALEQQRQLLQGARRELFTASQEYDALNPAGRALPQWAQTRDLLRQYGHILEVVVALGQEPAASGSVDVLLRDLTAYQTAILRQVEKLSEIHLRQIHDRETELLDWGARFRRQLFFAVGACLILACAIAALPMAHAWRTQRKLRAEHQKALDTKQELQRLSAELLRVQEEERRSLSRELHDEIGQTLTAARLDLALLEQKIPSQMSELQEFARDGKLLVEQTLQRVRELCRLLRPSLLDEEGLVPAVRWLVKGCARRGAIDIELETRGLDQRLPAEYELAAYRVVQDALTNIARHSGATRASVRIHNDGDALRLVVQDNGAGLPSGSGGQPQNGGLGLVGLRERMEQLGGRLEIASTPSGMCLTAQAPLRPAA
jgi:signal transduction histidine kinase